MEMGYDKDKYTGNQYVGLRFASVSIPTNCMIRNAYIEFTVKSTGACCDRNLQISVRMQKHANAPRFQAAGAKNVLHDIWTKSSTEYFKRYVPQIDKKPGDKAYTPTFAKAMQEVVDMPDWKQGNAMVVIFGDSSAKTVRESREYLSADNDAAKAALLVIEYYELDKWNLRVDALPYVAYASAAIFRTINCWMPAIVGGRVNTVLNSVLLCVPMILCSVALSLNACPYPFLWLCVFLSGGFAGGQLATCVNNVSNYFPKRRQGTLLGLMVGLATLGEAITLGLTAPLTSVGICAAGKDGKCDAKAMGRKYAFNLGAIWTLFLVAVSIGGWVRLNNLPGHGERATLRNIINYLKLSGVAVFWAAVISFAWWMTEEPIDGEAAASILRAFGLLLVIFFFAQGTLRICFRGVIGEKLKQQMSILRTRDAWLMTLLCFATLGTYIAWVWAFRTVAMALFISAQDNPREMMDADTFSFLGPLVGGISIIVGGYFADRFSGAAVTQWSTVGLFIGMFLALVFVQFGNDAKPTERESNLPLWCIASIIIFIFSGAGAGGVFRQIGFLYPPETRGPMLGFATGFATIGALFVVVLVVQAVVHEFTAIIFSLLLIVYIVVIIVNFCFYKRAASTNQC
jgi:NNP family nitrate/nitrite transporter-like MFS transporter